MYTQFQQFQAVASQKFIRGPQIKTPYLKHWDQN